MVLETGKKGGDLRGDGAHQKRKKMKPHKKTERIKSWKKKKKGPKSGQKSRTNAGLEKVRSLTEPTVEGALVTEKSETQKKTKEAGGNKK